MDFKIDDQDTAIEVTVSNFGLRDELDGWLLENSLDACGTTLWSSPSSSIFLIHKNQLEGNLTRLVQVLRRFGFKSTELRTFIESKYIPEWIEQDPWVEIEGVQDSGVEQTLKISRIKVYGDFDDRMLFNALFCCHIDARFEPEKQAVKLVIVVPIHLPGWQAKRLLTTLLRYGFSNSQIASIRGLMHLDL